MIKILVAEMTYSQTDQKYPARKLTAGLSPPCSTTNQTNLIMQKERRETTEIPLKKRLQDNFLTFTYVDLFVKSYKNYNSSSKRHSLSKFQSSHSSNRIILHWPWQRHSRCRVFFSTNMFLQTVVMHFKCRANDTFQENQFQCISFKSFLKIK